MTTDLAQGLQAAEAQHAPAVEQAERRKARLAALDEEIAALSGNLAAIDQGIATVHQRGRGDLESLRKERRDVAVRLEGLRAERPVLERYVEEAVVQVRELWAAVQVARRRAVQAEGAQVSSQIRTLLADVLERYRRWQALSEEDQRAGDICRGLDGEALTRVPTFEYATRLDGWLRAALDDVQRAAGR